MYNCWLGFFLFLCRFQEKIEPSLGNKLISTADWGGEQNTSDTQNTLIFLSAIAVMQLIFWTEEISAFFLIAGILSTANSIYSFYFIYSLFPVGKFTVKNRFNANRNGYVLIIIKHSNSRQLPKKTFLKLTVSI